MQLVITNALNTGLDWQVTDLDGAWNQDNFSYVYLSKTNAITGVVSSQSAPASGSDYFTPVKHYTHAFADGTYNYYIAVKRAGSSTYEFYGPFGFTISNRPAGFNWTYAGCTADGTPVAGTVKSSSYGLYVTAAEWNALIDNVVAVYTYKGWANPGLAHVVQGTDMQAEQYNAVKNAIDSGLPDMNASVSNIVYSDFNTLQDRLNAIT